MTLEPKKRRDPSIDRPIVNQCTAHRRNGDQCRRSAIKGSNVCATHGGSAPQVKRAAQVRLMMAADRVAGLLLQIADDQKVPVQVRLAAMRDILDRAGLVATQQIALAAEVTTQTWEQRADAAVVDWGELAELMPPTDTNVVDAELVVENEAHEQEWDRRLEAPRSSPPRTSPAEAERQVAALPVKAPQPEEAPPWISAESGAETATRRADEHRAREFAKDKASKGLSPRTTRPRQ